MASEGYIIQVNTQPTVPEQSSQHPQYTFPLAPIRNHPDGDEDMVATILLIIITLIFPPLGVLVVAGCSADLLINIVLCFFGFFPGHIHAFYLEYIYFKRQDEARMGIYSGERAPFVFSNKVQTGGVSENRAPPAPPATETGPVYRDNEYGTMENPPPPQTGPSTGPAPEYTTGTKTV